MIPLEIYEQFKNDIKKVNRLGAISTDTVSQFVCDKWAAELLKQGLSDSQAENIIQNKIRMQDDELYNQIWSLTALSKWFQNGKQIYRFDKNLIDVLQTSKDLSIPLDCLDLLPISSFFIQTEENKGFFFFFSDFDEKGDYFCLLTVNGEHIENIYSIPFFDGEKISKAVEKLTGKAENKTTKAISDMLQLVLYLAAVNAEITDTKDKTVTAKSVEKTAKQAKKKAKSGNNIMPTLYYVGRDFGKRYVQHQSEKTDTANGTKKRPHIRRSHFHHYWAGSGDDRKLILKWVDTIFVNADDNNDVLPTVRNVKNEYNPY